MREVIDYVFCALRMSRHEQKTVANTKISAVMSQTKLCHNQTNNQIKHIDCPSSKAKITRIFFSVKFCLIFRHYIFQKNLFVTKQIWKICLLIFETETHLSINHRFATFFHAIKVVSLIWV